ncbi:beta strand repeat-containing protein, partial [Maribacter chungangensis]
MKPIVILALLLCLSSTVVFGQIKIGDNPQNIDASSVLELESTDRVLVITRVNNLTMESITPLRGAVLYNTDTQCLHYFNGTEWINLCDAVSFSLTNDPIVNTRSTISITDNGGTINLEVAPNSIRSENIVDGGINGDDIQDNSIGESKLGADSVSANELRDNSVGTTEVIDGSITAADIANSGPNQILTTDDTGAVNWVDANTVSGVATDGTTITGTGVAGDVLSVSDAVRNAISVNSQDIAEHIGSDMDTDARNELTDLFYDSDTNILSLTRSEVGTTIDLGGLNNPGTDNQTLDLTGNTLSISGGNNVDLQGYLDNTDAQELEINGNVISISGGNDITLPAGAVDTDNQSIIGGAVVGNDLRIDIEDGTSGLIDISSLTVTGTDNQGILGGEVVGNDLRIDIEDGASGTIDISSLIGSGTDSQNLTGATLSPTNILQIDIQNGNSTTVDLNALAGGGTQNLTSVLGNGSSAGNLQINDVADPTLPQDVATQNYVETRIATILAAGGADGVVSAITPSATGFDVVGVNGGFNGSVDLNANFVTEAELAATNFDDADANPINEIQTLAIAGNDLTLSNGGGTVTIPAAGAADWTTLA